MKKIISTLAVIILIAGCSQNPPIPPPVVNTSRDVSVRFGIKVASASSGYYVMHRLITNANNIIRSLPPSNGNVVFTTPVTYHVCSDICGGERFCGSGTNPDQIQWYGPIGVDFPFVAYIMLNNDTVFKRASFYSASYRGNMVEYNNDECLKKF